MNENLSPYKEAYITEAREHLDTINSALIRLEKTPDDPLPLGEIFRAVHTLKSMAGTMDYTETAALSHAVEDCLTEVKNGVLELGSCINLLFKSFDLLETNLKLIEAGSVEQATTEIVEKLKKSAEEKKTSISQATEEPIQEIQTPVIEKISRINVKVERLDTLMNLAEELLVAKMKLDQTSDRLIDPDLSANADKMGRLITDLQYHVMQVRLVPVGFIFNRFPRMVRDLAYAQGKEIDLVMEGGDIEVDRGIVDEISEALVHLIRNAVDHGLETAEERKSKGKKSKGTIGLTALRTKDNVQIQVHDDGRGLDLDEIRRVAVSKGLGESPLREEETKDHEKLKTLLFSGLSTSPEVTPISGRGIGLPVVKKKIEAIGGSVAVASPPGEGTLFTLEIPLTMAVIKTLFAQVDGKTYAIPITNVERLVKVAESDVKGQLGTEALVLNGEDVPLIRLADLFGNRWNNSPPPPLSARGGSASGGNLRGGEGELQQLPVVVVRRGQGLLGLGVDSLLATEEVVVKPLSSLVRKNRYFSGSAVIGSGEVVLILDVGHLALAERRV